MYQLWVLLAIIVIAGLLGGWAAYLLDFVSSDEGPAPLKRHALIRYLVLGVIAAAVVPLFLSVLQSALIESIFKSNAETIPFANFFVFAGFCLVAALSARAFLDTVSRQVMRDVSQAKARAQRAEDTANRADEKATIASDLIQETVEDEISDIPAAMQAAEDLPANTLLPKITSSEHRALNAMTKMSFRTATGISQDAGVPRNQVGELLDQLATKGLIERTTSPKTGGPRWRITPIGIRTLNATKPK